MTQTQYFRSPYTGELISIKSPQHRRCKRCGKRLPRKGNSAADYCRSCNGKRHGATNGKGAK